MLEDEPAVRRPEPAAPLAPSALNSFERIGWRRLVPAYIDRRAAGGVGSRHSLAAFDRYGVAGLVGNSRRAREMVEASE